MKKLGLIMLFISLIAFALSITLTGAEEAEVSLNYNNNLVEECDNILEELNEEEDKEEPKQEIKEESKKELSSVGDMPTDDFLLKKEKTERFIKENFSTSLPEENVKLVTSNYISSSQETDELVSVDYEKLKILVIGCGKPELSKDISYGNYFYDYYDLENNEIYLVYSTRNNETKKAIKEQREFIVFDNYHLIISEYQ